jgi:C1A family cysteine protease
MVILDILVKFFKNLFKKKKKRVYGWKKDKIDTRDKKFKVSQYVPVPSSADLSTVLPSIYDQGKIGSCTGNAIAAAIQYDLITQDKSFDWIPSRLFIYYNERMIEGTINEDSGACIRDGIKVVNEYGVCKETVWPYIESQFTVKPSEQAYTEALLHRSVEYSRLDGSNINELKACIASGCPFIFGFQVYEYFEGEEMAKTGILRMPQPKEKRRGGHAVSAFAYSDEKQAFLVRNSWGSGWGINGHFWMPYEYITNPKLACDFWVIKTVTSGV